MSMVVSLVVFQLFLARFVFRNRNFPDITVTVDNRYMYTLPLYVLDCIHLILCRFRKNNVTMVTAMVGLEESMADSSKPTVEDAPKVILTENDVPAASGFFEFCNGED